MKKVLFLLAVLFAFTATTATASTESADKRPKYKKGYNYEKARKQAARHNFHYRPYNKNGGCGWANPTRR